MSLIFRVTLLFVFVSLVVFVIGGIISFNIMMREVNSEQQRFLLERLDRVTRMIERRQPKDTLKMNKLLIVKLAGEREDEVIFSDTLVMHSQLERIEPHLKLNAIRSVLGSSYSIIIYDVIIEPDDIKEGLVESLVTMYLILLGAVLVIGLTSSYYLLKPFNQTLSAIKKFSLADSDQDISFPDSGVREIKRLNLFLNEMTSKVRSDYQMLKEFSENASHELQTPIAIIQGKLDVLLNAEKLTEEQIGQVSSAQNTLRRLSNLSHSLSILAKIENKEFENASDLNLSDKLIELLEEFKELMQLKSIQLTTTIESEVSVVVDSVLIELLITNLINNAIRHNWENGSISIELTKNYLEVSNTGKDLSVNPNDLFTRFKKSNQSSSSLGLGLAIVKKVCDYYDYQVKYFQSEEQHRLKIMFKE